MSELTQRFKAKYPAYRSWDDAELERRVLAKYPQYAPLARESYLSESVPRFGKNLLTSTGNLIKDTAGSLVNVLNPDMEQNTLANLGKAGVGAAELFIPGEQGQEKYARAIGDFYKQRYGSIDNIKKTLYEDPAGALADISTVLTGGAGALKGAASLGKAGKLAKVANVVGRAGELSDPLRGITKGVSKIAGNKFKDLVKKMGRKIEASGEKAVTAGLGNPVTQSKLEQKFGIKPSEFINKYNLYDRDPTRAAEIPSQIMDRYNELALKSGKQTDLGTIISSIDNEISNLTSGANKYADANISAANELMRRKQQLLEMVGATDSQTPLMANIADITQYRRTLDKDIPQSMFNLDAKGSGTAQGAKTMRNYLRDAINSSDPEIAQLGREYGFSKGMSKVYADAAKRGSNRQLLSLPKLGSMGIGSYLAGAPGIVGGYLLEQMANSPKTAELSSKAQMNVGRALQSAQMPKIPNVAPAYNAARGARMINNSQQEQSKTLPTQTSRMGVQSQPQYQQPQKMNISQSPQTYVKPTQMVTPQPRLKKLPNLYKGSSFGAAKTVKRGSFY